MNRDMRDIAWLAGIVEGEGSFSLKNGCPRIDVQMTDRDVVERAAKLFGVSMSDYARQPKGKATYKPVFMCRVHGIRALGWMFTLYSNLGERRRAKIREIVVRWKASNHRLHASRGERFNADCHPDRSVTGFGLCKNCYMRRWRAQKKAA